MSGSKSSCRGRPGTADWTARPGEADARQPLDQPRSCIMANPARARCTLPRLPPGITPVRHLPVECWTISMAPSLALDAQAVHRVGQIDAPLLGDLLYHRHAAVEVRVERQHEGAVGERLHELGDRDLVLGQEHHRGNPRRRAVGAERGRGIARGGARHRVDGHAVGHHLLDDRDQHGHPQVLERARVRVAALLDPQVFDVELLAVAVGPEGRAALVVDTMFLGGKGNTHPYDPDAWRRDRCSPVRSSKSASPAAERDRSATMSADLEESRRGAAVAHSRRRIARGSHCA